MLTDCQGNGHAALLESRISAGRNSGRQRRIGSYRGFPLLPLLERAEQQCRRKAWSSAAS